ncbi:hypothetical protein H2508_06970 [Parahaliea sp. F7430]|uniref:Uncharacterized protein n=1 Tax=Sediminihaliea albiluteola TaxID=2758564 RepID=A0A7W2YK09_9GAMM|nr:hypothetical protein [Sediminihaliea albiluteola]MBA6412848.1 hypothetical protein [Sediminihaliea albiluteola]
MNTMTSKQRDLTIRQVSEDEIDKVSGGIAPAIGFAISLATHIGLGGVRTAFFRHALSGLSLGSSAYSLGTAYGGSYSRGDNPNIDNH